MVDKEQLMKIALSRYDFEHDKMEKINARIPHLITLFIAVCGIGAYFIQKAQAINNCEIASISWVIGILVLVLFCVATYYAFIVFRGYTYAYLPSMNDTVTHMKEYENALSGEEYNDFRDAYYQEELQDVMIKFSKDCADDNGEINATRTLALTKSIYFYSASGVATILLIGLIMVFSRANNSPNIPPNATACFSCGKSVYYGDTLVVPIKFDSKEIRAEDKKGGQDEHK